MTRDRRAPLGRGLASLLMLACVSPCGVGAQGSLPAAVERATPAPSLPDSVRRLTIALIDVTVAEALERLSDVAQMNIVWRQTSLGERAVTRISCRIDRGTAEQVLHCITRASDLDFYRLSSGTYVVIANSEAPPGWAALGGFVVDSATGAGLPSARLHLAEAQYGTVAGDDGAFTIAKLRPGRYALTVRALGYTPYTTTLDLDAHMIRRVRVALKRSDAVARPIIVNGIRPGEASALLAATSVADSAVRSVMGPSLFLPGIVSPLGVSRRDGSGDLHVQGGDIGEHPWRLDGISLYDVSSLSALLGVVSPLVIDRLTVQRAGYRASVGSFTAGAIDLMHGLGGDADARAATEASIDPFTATARVSAPIGLGAVSGRAMVAGRTGLWQWTAPPSMVRAVRHWSVPDPVLLARVSGFAALPGMEQLDRTTYDVSVGRENVTVQDVHVATSLSWGTGHQLSASAFTTAQGIRYDGLAPDSGNATLRSEDAYAWRSIGAQVSHQWLLGTRVRQQLQLRTSRHALDHDASMSMLSQAPAVVAAGERNTIVETTLAADWRVLVSPRITATFGTEISRANAQLDIANRVLRPLAVESTVWRGAGFVDGTAQLRSTLFMDAGLRVTQLQAGQRFAEPRVALRGESAASGTPWSWRLAGGGFHQFVTQFDVASTMPIAFVPSVRFWLPSDGRGPVAQAWHLAAEGVWRPRRGWEVRSEGYVKWLPSIPLFDYGVMYGDAGAPVAGTLTDATQFVQRGRGRAIGAGIRVLRDARIGLGTWRQEFAYDVGAATRRYPSRFSGQLQPPPWLEPHRVLLVSEYAPRRDVTLAVRGRGVFGRPWALRQAYYDLFGAAPLRSGLPIDMPGRMRRPAVLDVDIGASWHKTIAGIELDAGVSVTNLIDRANVMDYGLRRAADGSSYVMVPRLLPRRQPVATLQLRR